MDGRTAVFQYTDWPRGVSLKVSPEFASNLKYDLRPSFIKETLSLSGKGRRYISLTERDQHKRQGNSWIRLIIQFPLPINGLHPYRQYHVFVRVWMCSLGTFPKFFIPGNKDQKKIYLFQDPRAPPFLIAPPLIQFPDPGIRLRFQAACTALLINEPHFRSCGQAEARDLC